MDHHGGAPVYVRYAEAVVLPYALGAELGVVQHDGEGGVREEVGVILLGVGVLRAEAVAYEGGVLAHPPAALHRHGHEGFALAAPHHEAPQVDVARGAVGGGLLDGLYAGGGAVVELHFHVHDIAVGDALGVVGLAFGVVAIGGVAGVAEDVVDAHVLYEVEQVIVPRDAVHELAVEAAPGGGVLPTVGLAAFHHLKALEPSGGEHGAAVCGGAGVEQAFAAQAELICKFGEREQLACGALRLGVGGGGAPGEGACLAVCGGAGVCEAPEGVAGAAVGGPCIRLGFDHHPGVGDAARGLAGDGGGGYAHALGGGGGIVGALLAAAAFAEQLGQAVCGIGGRLPSFCAFQGAVCAAPALAGVAQVAVYPFELRFREPHVDHVEQVAHADVFDVG